MRSKLIALCICAVVFSGLLAAYFMLLTRTDSAESDSAQEEYYTILSRSEDELAGFSISSAEQTLTFTPDENSDTGWKLNDDAGILLDQYYLSSVLSGLTELGTAGRAAASADNLEEFGLEPPQAVTRIEYTDGGSDTLLLGRKTPDGEFYYFMKDGDPAVYLLNTYAGEKYALNFDELIDKSVPEVSTNELSYVYINLDGRELELSPENSDTLDEYGISGLKMSKPYQGRDVYLTDFTQSVLSGLEGLRFGELVEVGLSNEDSYGISANSEQIIIRDAENEINILIGNAAGDGKVYARRASDKMIFTLETAKLDSFRNFDVLSFMDRFIAFIDIDRVESMLINDGSSTTEILMNAEEAETKKIQHPTINGNPVELEEFKTLYQAMTSLSFDAEINVFEPETAPDYAITYYLDDGMLTKCEFYAYNDNFYAVSINDTPANFVTGRRSLYTVQRMLEGMF